MIEEKKRNLNRRARAAEVAFSEVTTVEPDEG